jgi:class 3 adenylate cyclase
LPPVIDLPETRYARTPEGDHIAYQILGDGPPDLMYLPHWATHVEVMWESPQLPAFLRRLSSFSRLIVFDKRGVGLSDPVPLPQLPTLEAWMEDVTAVMEASGSDRVALLAGDVAGFIAMLFAACHPERTTALILVNSTCRVRRASDYPPGIPDDPLERYAEAMLETWGQQSSGRGAMDPSVVTDPDVQAFVLRYQRATASPGTIGPMLRLCVDADLRHVLPNIRVPTLVLHRTGDTYFRPDHGRYLADHIPNAKYVELPGADHDPDVGDVEPVLAEIQDFLTGERPHPLADRILTTVLFTDTVSSTGTAFVLGDANWRVVLDRLDDAAERHIRRFRGHLVKATGDGHLATFDGPARAIHCGRAIIEAARGLGLGMRVGIHTGEVEVRGTDIGGVAVHIASRINAMAEPGEVLVSSTVKDLAIGSGIEFTSRGEHALKGVPDTWRLFALDS